MKKILFTTCFTLFLAGCSSSVNNVEQNNLVNKDTTKSAINSENIISNKEVRFTFKLLDAQSLSRIKSIDAYLVNDLDSPLLPASNVYTDGYKYQTNIDSNGIATIVFTGFPDGGPYYVALQAFDNTITNSSRNNITLADTTIVSGNNQVARSTNSVSYSSGIVTYTPSGSFLNVTIKLIPFNSPNLNITPTSGSNTPTAGITLE